MAALLAGLGTGAGIGSMASGATGVGGMIGQFLGSQIMGDVNKDTNGFGTTALNALYPGTSAGNTPQGYNPTGTQMPTAMDNPQTPQAPSTTSGWTQQQQNGNTGYSPLVAHLLGL